MSFAALKYRLYDIDLIINRALVYGPLTATLALVYVGGIVLLQRLLVILTGQESTLAVVASTLLIAALFNPLRRQVQGFVDRRFYRRKYDAARPRSLLRHAEDETDLEALNGDLVGVVTGDDATGARLVVVRPDTASKGSRPSSSPFIHPGVRVSGSRKFAYPAFASTVPHRLRGALRERV
jgi:hypothetical protein